MTWQVIQFMDENPQATMKTVIGHFAEQLEVDNQHQFILREVDHVLVIRDSLRPLYGEKADLEGKMMLLDSDFDMEVMMKYPPRQGTDKDRKKYKQELQGNHSEYPRLAHELETVKERISLLEDQMGDIQQKAKNARRILETFQVYAQFIMAHYNSRFEGSSVITEEPVNANVF